MLSSTESLTKHHQQRQTSRHHQPSPGEYKIRFGSIPSVLLWRATVV